MTGKGTVIKTDGFCAYVKIKKSSSCGHDCGECRLCNNPEIEAVVKNTAGAKAGDTVIIGSPSSKVLFSAFILYILPIMGIMAICAVTSYFFGTACSVISALIWIILWLLLIRRYSKHYAEAGEILEVVNEKN